MQTLMILYIIKRNFYASRHFYFETSWLYSDNLLNNFKENWMNFKTCLKQGSHIELDALNKYRSLKVEYIVSRHWYSLPGSQVWIQSVGLFSISQENFVGSHFLNKVHWQRSFF